MTVRNSIDFASSQASRDRTSFAKFVGMGFMLLGDPTLGAEGFTVGLGMDYSTGYYDETVATDILFIPFLLKWEQDPWTIKVTVPYVRITGPGDVVLEDGAITSTRSDSTQTTTQSGLGDTTLAVSRTLWTSHGGGIGTELTGKVKFPTADQTKGLGTGKADATLVLDAYGALGSVTLFTSIGYRWMGDPAGTSYRNIWLGSGGFSVKPLTSVNMGVFYDYRQSVRVGSTGGSEFSPFASFKLGTKYKLQWYATFGLSSGSADRGTGLVLQRNF